MIKISFTPEFLQWVALQMRANDTGLDAHQFAVEFFHRAFVGRGAEVLAAAPALLAACEMAFEDLEQYEDTDLPGGYAVMETVQTLRAAIALASEAA